MCRVPVKGKYSTYVISSLLVLFQWKELSLGTTVWPINADMKGKRLKMEPREQHKRQTVWVAYYAMTQWTSFSYNYYFITSLIERTPKNHDRKMERKARKRAKHRCNQRTKFALVVSQNTFLKGKKKGGLGSVLLLIHSLKSHCRVCTLINLSWRPVKCADT